MSKDNLKEDVLEIYKCLISCCEKTSGMALEDAFSLEALDSIKKEYAFLQQTKNTISSEKYSRLILCRNCSDFMQAPNPEMGTCKVENATVRYDSPCLFGLSEKVEVPEIETVLKNQIDESLTQKDAAFILWCLGRIFGEPCVDEKHKEFLEKNRQVITKIGNLHEKLMKSQ
jgi:hypothetical protein